MLTLLLIMDEHLALAAHAHLISLALHDDYGCIPSCSGIMLFLCHLALSLSLADDDGAIYGIAHAAAPGLQLYGGIALTLAFAP